MGMTSTRLLLLGPQLAAGGPVARLHVEQQDVHLLGLGAEGVHASLRDGLHQVALLLRRAAFEHVDSDGGHRFSPSLRKDRIVPRLASFDAWRVSMFATRRTALKAALGVGYAAAAGPLIAQNAIRTPADGLTVGEISYEVNGFKVPAYRAAPAGKTGLPVVLVISEVFGVHEYIADTARRFARAGYLAIAPELYARQGDPGSYGEMARLMSEVVSKVPDAQVMADLDGALKWAAANGGDASKAGITGFCWGGRVAWLYAAHAPIKAA